MIYGVVPTGFNKKPLAVVLAEIEQAAINVFGPGVIQTPQSPLGQLNGIFSEAAAILYEHGEDVYQSYDPDQAESVRLDALGKLRLIERAVDEGDASYRQAITNLDRARIDMQDLQRAIVNIDGVTYAHVFVNDLDVSDDDGLPGHAVAVAVLGGDDTEIATTIRRYVVPGISTYGNTRIDSSVDGFCRTIYFSRPVAVPITLLITVNRSADSNGCPPAALSAIEEGFLLDMETARRPINGEDISVFLVRSAIEARFPNVEVVSVTGSRAGDAVMPLGISFDEIASFIAANITIVNA